MSTKAITIIFGTDLKSTRTHETICNINTKIFVFYFMVGSSARGRGKEDTGLLVGDYQE